MEKIIWIKVDLQILLNSKQITKKYLQNQKMKLNKLHQVITIFIRKKQQDN